MVARRAAATPLPLPLHGTAARACGIALAGLMVCARGEHFANVDALPTASWAVFFLAGALLRPLWMLPLLFGIVSLLDLIGLASGSSSDWCLSPAYWALALAYAALWWGGLPFASQLQRQAWRRVTGPLLALLISGSAAYVLSKAGSISCLVATRMPRSAGSLRACRRTIHTHLQHWPAISAWLSPCWLHTAPLVHVHPWEHAHDHPRAR